jgi:histone H3/H4
MEATAEAVETIIEAIMEIAAEAAIKSTSFPFAYTSSKYI